MLPSACFCFVFNLKCQMEATERGDKEVEVRLQAPLSGWKYQAGGRRRCMMSCKNATGLPPFFFFFSSGKFCSFFKSANESGSDFSRHAH